MATFDAFKTGVDLSGAVGMEGNGEGGYFPAYSVRSTPQSGGGASFNYRMRGFDTNGSVNNIVYWNSVEIDSDASDYSGSAGPVVDIVIQRIVTA